MNEPMVRPSQLAGFILSTYGQVFCDTRGFVGTITVDVTDGGEFAEWLAVAKDGRRRRFDSGHFALACEWLRIAAGSPRVGDSGRINRSAAQ